MEDAGLIVELLEARRALLAPWRATPGAALLSHEGRLFVRGLPPEALPGFPRWRIEGVSWIPAGLRLPAPAPTGAWQTLASALVPEVPRGLLPGRRPEGLDLVLRRSPAEKEATLLAAPWEALEVWAATAPQARLEKLRFAVRRAGHGVCAFLSGHPLPPLPGTRFHRQGALALPAGFTIDLPEAEVVRLLGLSAGAVAVLWPRDPEAQTTGVSCERLAADCFVPLSRAAVRATGAAMAGLAPSVEGGMR